VVPEICVGVQLARSASIGSSWQASECQEVAIENKHASVTGLARFGRRHALCRVNAEASRIVHGTSPLQPNIFGAEPP
jgi:hypothetical protein